MLPLGSLQAALGSRLARAQMIDAFERQEFAAGEVLALAGSPAGVFAVVTDGVVECAPRPSATATVLSDDDGSSSDDGDDGNEALGGGMDALFAGMLQAMPGMVRAFNLGRQILFKND